MCTELSVLILVPSAVIRVSGSELTAVARSQLLARWPGTLSLTLSGIRRAAQTVLGVYLKRTGSRVTSASSALGVLNDYALYKSTHSLTHSHSPLPKRRPTECHANNKVWIGGHKIGLPRQRPLTDRKNSFRSFVCKFREDRPAYITIIRNH